MKIQAFAIAALIAATACGSSGGSIAGTTTGTGNTNPPTPPPAPTQTNAVSVGNDFFSPTAIQVSPGTTVTWTWSADAVTHNVTFTDGTGSGDKGASATFSKTFATPGTFNYQCTIHAMQGSVLVQ